MLKCIKGQKAILPFINQSSTHNPTIQRQVLLFHDITIQYFSAFLKILCSMHHLRVFLLKLSYAFLLLLKSFSYTIFSWIFNISLWIYHNLGNHSSKFGYLSQFHLKQFSHYKECHRKPFLLIIFIYSSDYHFYLFPLPFLILKRLFSSFSFRITSVKVHEHLKWSEYIYMYIFIHYISISVVLNQGHFCFSVLLSSPRDVTLLETFLIVMTWGFYCCSCLMGRSQGSY